ncbi:hypothetical protein HanPSC8_Chr03g0089621 [Helianthus annuus]|nr:hypothetical protein HanPSC8_Chr03g0089621 [Helianthus annuus]
MNKFVLSGRRTPRNLLQIILIFHICYVRLEKGCEYSGNGFEAYTISKMVEI